MIPKSNPEWTSGSDPEAILESTAKSAPEPATQSAPETTPELAPELTLESELVPTSELAPELILNTESESGRSDSELSPLHCSYLISYATIAIVNLIVFFPFFSLVHNFPSSTILIPNFMEV